ncbi:unnamed protein product [Strongylus vulgaris]|uniref:Uncharacterized protein n=1 Tax=Strongylus vulgaris TaxID=40348 RepID=A0A3P7LZH4_STRVU|nr:unnamed protein product [Strongylus vulgaris]
MRAHQIQTTLVDIALLQRHSAASNTSSVYSCPDLNGLLGSRLEHSVAFSLLEYLRCSM